MSQQEEAEQVILMLKQQEQTMMEMMNSITKGVEAMNEQVDEKIKELSDKVEYLQKQKENTNE